MRLVDLELDLDVFAGPFDLLLTLILREEIDLLEVDLAEIVIAYIDHLERRGELELEAATEFLVLIAALLELKSRLLLPGEETRRSSSSTRGRPPKSCSRGCSTLTATAPPPPTFRSSSRPRPDTDFARAPLPPSLRRAPLQDAGAVYEPAILAGAIGELLRMPEPVDVRHISSPKVTVAERLAHLRTLLARGSFSFDEAVARADRVTVAITLFALLELYKQGEATWSQDEPFGEITIEALPAAPAKTLRAAG